MKLLHYTSVVYWVCLILTVNSVPIDGAVETRIDQASFEHFTSDSTIDDYLSYAFDNNAALKAADKRADAASESVKQSGYFPEPILSYEHMVEQHDTQYRVGISQQVPGFGKLRLRKRVAGFRAERIKHDAEALRLMVFEQVIKAFYEYHYLGSSIRITKDNVELLDDLEKVVESRFKTKQVKYSDLLKVQVERDKLKDQLEGLREMRPVLSAKLSALLNLPKDAPVLPWPKVATSASAVLSYDILMDMLDTLNPELRSVDATVKEFGAERDFAARSIVPDFMFGVSYMLMPEVDNGSTPEDYGLMLGISVPVLFGKYRSEKLEANLKKDAALNLRSQLENDLSVELRVALYELQDAERQIKLLNESLIPKAEQAFEVARKEFSNSEASFITLIDAQRTLFDLSLNLERARVDKEIAIGEIGCCVGKHDLKALGLD